MNYKKLFVFIVSPLFLLHAEKNPHAPCEAFFRAAGPESMYQKTVDCYERTLPTDFENFQPHVNNAEALLAIGDYKNGFRELDWRLKVRNPLEKPWDGTNPNGKTILVYGEQGLGDSFFFSRYLKILKELGATVIFRPQGLLVTLFTQCDFIDTIVKKGQKPPYFDYDVYLMSLPRYMNQENGKAQLTPSTVETVPNVGPYLFPKQEHVNYWKKRLNNNDFKIGICWCAGPLSPGVVRELERDIPLNLLGRLANIDGVRVYSFQDGKTPIRESKFENMKASGKYSQEELKKLAYNVISDDNEKIYVFDEKTFDGEHGAFMDTAAAMHCMDLIVSVDTAIPNLAGAMHLPTWILLAHVADWRWMTERTDSPWQPTGLLFRQETEGDWEPVIDKVVEEVKKLKNR